MSIMDYLNNGEVDLVFNYDTHLPDAQSFEPLFDAPPYALVPASEAISARNSVTFAELSSRPMIMLDLPYTRDYFLGMFKERGLSQKHWWKVNSAIRF